MAGESVSLKSDFKAVIGKSNEEFLQLFIQVFREKRPPTVTRSLREFGDVKNWDLQAGIWLNPIDKRFNAVILIGDRAQREKLYGITFSGMVVTLASLIEIMGDYEVGRRDIDKSAAFIFTMNDASPWIGAFEFNVRKRAFEKEPGGKLMETLESGEKVEVNPAELEFNVFTVHFVEPPGRTELFYDPLDDLEEETVDPYAGMTEDEIKEAKRLERIERMKKLKNM